MSSLSSRLLTAFLIATLNHGCARSPAPVDASPAPPAGGQKAKPPVAKPLVARPLPAPAQDVESVVGGNNAFALDLYARLRSQKGNLFLSPYSLSTALAMTYAGARGRTASEMKNTLRFPLGQERLHPAFAALAAGLKPQGSELHIANRLWGHTGYRFLGSYLNLMRSHYGAELKQLDFEAATEEARQTINSWIEHVTKKKIKELLKPGMLDSMTRLVLTNAIYFKGQWKSPFNKKDTKDGLFTLLDGSTVLVPMMVREEGDFRYDWNEELQVLELPYAGKELSMIILLPARTDGLPELEKKLTPDALTKWLSNLKDGEIDVVLPKFTITSEFSLPETLKAMGMKTAFASGADFSGMTGSKELFISEVAHKAFIDVNEEGTEAAAATADVMTFGASLPVRVDHPFLFLIRESRTKSILFLGRVMNPSE